MLDLQAPTRRAFEFLEYDYGFSRTQEGPDLVAFTTSIVEVKVRFDSQRSFELGITVALRDEVASRTDEPPYSLGEVLRTVDAPEATRLACVQVTNQASLGNFLGEMASALRRCGADLLQGKPTSFRALAQNREAECRDYGVESVLVRVRGLVDEAWAKRDYAAVVKAFSSVRGELLSVVDRKRLDIARSRLV